MNIVKEAYLSGERALFKSNGIEVIDSIFADGESPLKESSNISISGSIFKWKYPLWYCNNIKMKDSTLLETARSGIWYSHNLDISNCIIDAPKTFRRSSNIRLDNVNMVNALESFWKCKDIKLNKVNAAGDYFLMNSDNIEVDGLMLSGNYCFDGASNIVVRNSKLISKDAFWNCENVTVYDSVIVGEYLAWNSKNVTFVNCTIESLQGLCYIDGLKMVNCKLINTNLAFEFCKDIDASIDSSIISITNPISGRIKAKSIGEIIIDKDNETIIEVEE